LAIDLFIKAVVFLKLDFAEVDVAFAVGWQKYAIDAEAGYTFDFKGIKGIASNICG
jgi:hypothetical protein